MVFDKGNFFFENFDFSVVDYSRNFSIFDDFLTFGKSGVKWSKMTFFKIVAHNPLKTPQTPRNSICSLFRPILKEEIGFCDRRKSPQNGQKLSKFPPAKTNFSPSESVGKGYKSSFSGFEVFLRDCVLRF